MNVRLISICILGTIWSSILFPQHAQARQKDKVTVEEDTVAFFRGLSVSADVVGLAQLTFGDYGQYEGALRVNIKDKYFPIVEIGYGKADTEDVATKNIYKSKAPYLRGGIDFNMMRNKHDINRIYVGMRYAYSSFTFDVEHPDLTDPVWGDKAQYGAKDVDAWQHWAELVAGIDAKIFGPFRLGWSVRYKRRIARKENDFGAPWYVPGYGKGGNSRLGGTFNIILEI